MTRLYRYQGPQTIAHAVSGHPEGYSIQSVGDVESWIRQTEQQTNQWGLIEATFVITQQGLLYLADRHSEHVACAGGQVVRSAGEMFFALSKDGWEVRDVSNQSMGYCPEPASWPEVAVALDRIPLSHPDTFTQSYLFRRCPNCQQINLIKELVFICTLCDSELPQKWNLENGEEAERV